MVTLTHLYVCREKADGRLGLSRFPKTASGRDVPFPMQLRIPGIRIVSLVAGGMSFHALDSEGQIYVWGTLDGTSSALRSDGFAEPGQKTETPLRLQMPNPTRSISWGRPFKFASQVFNQPISKPRQVECGWNFSSVLTTSGEVYVWWPFSGEIANRIRAMNAALQGRTNRAEALPDKSIRCVTCDLDFDPVQLPPIPVLPDLANGADDGKPTQLIQIAGMNEQIVGLTNKGHVLKYGNLQSDSTFSRGRWEYLPMFSQDRAIQKQLSEVGVNSTGPVKITHISGNFRKFVAYSTNSSSVVLVGSTETLPTTEPEIIPELQHKSIISVVLGDYHNAALTSTGKVFTWGAYSSGALGLGDPATLEVGAPGGFETEQQRRRAENGRVLEPPAVTVPTEVRFDHGRKSPRDRFCFAVVAAGWHTGALVIDLEPDDQEDEPELASEERFPPQHMHEQTAFPGQGPPIVPFPGFRIGFAGRGRGMGGGRGGTGGGRGRGIGQ
ncbi:hypothetical protein H0H92_009921 [Tricholoma furcatifolium]|nr:hypothetical protein H0H92_009921 [Tricholoma furcatifolium]